MVTMDEKNWFGALVCLVIGTMACGDGDVVNYEQTRSGLTLYSANVEDGLSGTYSDSELEIVFETARFPRDESLQSTGRDFDLAIRILDGNGNQLFVLAEGHELPEGWSNDDLGVYAHPVDEKLYGLALLAAQELQHAKLAEELLSEKELLVQQMRSLGNSSEEDTLSITDISHMQLNQQMKTLQKSARSYRTVYFVQFINSFWKPAFIQGARAQHTSTITYRYAHFDGEWHYQTSFTRCNHGSCPQDSSMSYYQSHLGPVTFYAPVTPQSCSGFYGRPHVCNNDTELQQDNVQYNRMYNTWGSDQCTYTGYYAPN